MLKKSMNFLPSCWRVQIQGEEADTARTYIRQLVAEHRQLEAMWKDIEKDLRLLSKGKTGKLNSNTASKLAIEYLAHAEFEERYFFPLSAKNPE